MRSFQNQHYIVSKTSTVSIFLLFLGLPSTGSDQRASNRQVPGPAINSSSQVVKLEAGSTARFPCQVTNLGPLVLIWKHGTRVLTAGVGAGTMHVKKDPRVSLAGTDLIISNITDSDAGQYSCELDTDQEYTLSLQHTLQILVAPQLQRHPTSGELFVKKGSTVSLKCQASGFPVPQISWSKKNGLLDSGLKFLEGSIYTIHNISRHQAGVYKCQASNGVGYPVIQEIHLTVLYSPEVRAELDIVHTGLHRQASLSCIVHANPQAVIRWYRESLLLDTDNNFLLESKGTLHTFIIREVKKENFGTFSCSASNTFGKQTAHVLVTGIPKAPVFRSNLLSKSSNSHTLTWVTESYSPVSEYRVIYRKISDTNTKDVLYVWTNINLRSEQHEGVIFNKTYILDNLDEDSKYEAKVEARNVFGWSNQSNIFNFFTRNADDAPKQLPIEPEKTPAPSKSGDFQQFSSSKKLSISAVLRSCVLVFFVKYSL